MAKIPNPFIVTGKIPPALFCDRKSETADLAKFLNNEENVVLMSQRRMGKTKLVEHCFERQTVASNSLLISIDILHTTSFQEFVQVFGGAVFDAVAKRNTRLMKLFTSTLRSLSASFGYDPVRWSGYTYCVLAVLAQRAGYKTAVLDADVRHFRPPRHFAPPAPRGDRPSCHARQASGCRSL